jgi:hypothetical protein
LQRLPLKLPYPGVVAAIGAVMARLPRTSQLLVDNTGVGRGIYDMLVHEGWSPVAVTITGGDRVLQEGRRFSVPKATLVSKLVQLTHSGNLAVHGSLKEWPALRHELEIFRPEITPSGRETWNSPSTGHDDLLTATALCAWYIQHDDMSSWGNYELTRQRALAAGHRDTNPEEFVCGVDIGQSNDPTAICVMSRIDGPDPRTDRHFVEVMQPESTVDGSDYLGSSEWLADVNEQTKRALIENGQIGSGPLASGFTPRTISRQREDPQPGNAEWCAIEREKMRFQALLNGRDPLAPELADHESRLAAIREQHAV